jgi:signal transduction histidine kinase
VRKDGTRFWSETLLAALRRPDGTLRGYARITRDLTERHEAEERIRRLNDNLERLVRERTAALQDTVEELEAFNHTVAHDVRAPLRSVVGMGEILLEEYRGKALDERAEGWLREIVSAGQRMDRMTQELLAYSRLSREDVTLEALDPGPVVAETLSEMAADLEARKAAVRGEPFPWPVRGSRLLLKQILTNLLYNAIKFVGPGVEPKVRVLAEDRGPWSGSRSRITGSGSRGTTRRNSSKSSSGSMIGRRIRAPASASRS